MLNVYYNQIFSHELTNNKKYHSIKWNKYIEFTEFSLYADSSNGEINYIKQIAVYPNLM